MAVLIRESNGAIVDHSGFRYPVLTTSPEKCKPSTQPIENYKMKKELFEVYTPFYLDSQAQRILRESEKDSKSDPSLQTTHIVERETSAQRKRRKRKPPVLSEDEEKISQLLEREFPCLISLAKEHNVFMKSSKDFLQIHSNNKTSRMSASSIGHEDLFQELCSQEMEGNTEIKEGLLTLNEMLSSKNHSSSSFIHKLVENSENVGLQIVIENETFFIPAQSRFMMSSFSSLVSQLHGFLTVQDGYDLILIDPPWSNKSVKRKKSYHTFDESELCSFPLHSLAKVGGLVCVWVTNNERILSYVKDVVLPAWNVKWVSDWYWMKVTKCGEPVCDIRSPHKKPYERLVIGRMEDMSNQDKSSSDLRSTQTAYLDQDILKTVEKCSTAQSFVDSEKVIDLSVPKDYVLVSVPCSLHSKKPFLSDVLSPYLPSQPKCLEMFARNLTPGWTSWGNEVLIHQHSDYYEVIS